MNTLRHIVFGAGIAGLLAASCCGFALAGGAGDDAVDERQPLSAGGSVSINDNLPGDVTVSAWNKSEVGIGGASGCQDGWEFGGTPSALTLSIKLSTHSRNVDDCDLHIQLPADAALSLKTISADVSLSGAGGPLKIFTVSGNVTAQSPSQDVVLQTISGDLHVTGPQGKLSFKSASGNLTLGAATLSELKAESASGDIDLDSAYTTHARVSVTTISGDVTLHVPKGFAGSVLLKSFSGDLPCESDDSILAHPGRAGLGKVCQYGQTDGKGASLVLSSQSGDLTIDGKLGAAVPPAQR
jgi:hypothetical protein